MEYLYIICIGLLAFFSLSLLSRRGKSLSERIFAVWIVLLLFTVVSFLLHVRSLAGRFPVFMTIICDSHLVHGVLLFLYARAFTDKGFTLQRRHLWHAAPVLLFTGGKLILNYGFNVLECYSGGVCMDEHENGFVLVTYVYKYIVLGAYIYFTWKLSHEYRKNARSPREQMRLDWVRQISLGAIFLLFGVLLLHIGRLLFPDLFWERMLLGNVLSTLFIFIFLYIGNSYAYIFVSPSRKRFTNLSESPGPERRRQEEDQQGWHKLYARLEMLMEEEEPFAEGQLTIEQIALILEVPVVRLSQAINQVSGTNFNDFINAYRVKKLQALLSDPANRKFKIMSLAHDCGFSSKSSLIRIFKAQTGQTPSEYQASHAPEQGAG